MAIAWASIAELERKLRRDVENVFEGEVLELQVRLHGDVFMLSGAVASEACKAAVHRKLLGFDRVFKVKNDLQVTGFLTPAGPKNEGETHPFDGSATFDAVPGTPRQRRTRAAGHPGGANTFGSRRVARRRQDASNAPPAEEIVRRPLVAVTGNISPGLAIEIEVDLPPIDPERPEERLSFGVMQAGWTSFRVDAQLASPDLEGINAVVRFVTVNEDGTSTPARFRARVREDVPGSEIKIDAAFFHGTRFSGSVSTEFPLSGQTPSETIADDEEETPLESVVLELEKPGLRTCLSVTCSGRLRASGTMTNCVSIALCKN
jgi:hypothetical protein